MTNRKKTPMQILYQQRLPHIVKEGIFEQLKEKGGMFAEMIKRQEL